MFVTFLKLFFEFLLAIIKQTTSIFSKLQFRKIPTDAPETASSFPGTCFLHLPPFERFLCAIWVCHVPFLRFDFCVCCGPLSRRAVRPCCASAAPGSRLDLLLLRSFVSLGCCPRLPVQLCVFSNFLGVGFFKKNETFFETFFETLTFRKNKCLSLF